MEKTGWKLAMRIFQVLILMCFLIFQSSEARANCEPGLIVGSWQFDHIIYQGQSRPPFNPDLKITFDFLENGESRLFWSRTNQQGFCERKGEYSYQNCGLTDRVTWLNPQNSRECDLDPDMRLGHTTITYAEIDEAGEFRLHLQLGEEELIYVLKQADTEDRPNMRRIEYE